MIWAKPESVPSFHRSIFPSDSVGKGRFSSGNIKQQQNLQHSDNRVLEMTRVTWIVLFGGLAGAKLHAEVLKHAPPGITYHVPKGILPTYSSKVVPVNHHVHQLRPVSTRHGFAMNLNSKSAASVLGIHQRHAGGFGYENITTTSAYGTQYAIEATWDGHPLSLLIDTGSSDTWAVSKDFHCIDYTGQFLPQSSCGFGEAYPDAFQYGRTDPPTHMFIQYGDGEIVTGPMGFSDITIGNITVKKQQVCLANTTYWFGNNYTSGLLGLAFPSLTNAYYGDSGTDHDYGSQVQYSPLFTSMVSQGLVDPLFSIAIDRNASSGMISFGGIAPAVGADFSRSATLDMIIVSHCPRLSVQPTFVRRLLTLPRRILSVFPQPHFSTLSTPSSPMAGTLTRL